MSTPIYAKDVPVKTRPVEVKIIQVGPKQMSLSMFKQLRDREIIDDTTGELKGLEWGRVWGVWPGCCMDAYNESRKIPPHNHVIWESGGLLYKCGLWSVDRQRFPKQISYLEGIDQLFIGV